jgi:hypothetical protein
MALRFLRLGRGGKRRQRQLHSFVGCEPENWDLGGPGDVERTGRRWKRVEDFLLALDRFPVVVDAVAVRHHDQQPAAIVPERAQLFLEEARVPARLTPELIDEAKVARGRDERDLDPVTVRSGIRNQRSQLRDAVGREQACRRGRVELTRHEHVPRRQDVARRVAVGERRGRSRERQAESTSRRRTTRLAKLEFSKLRSSLRRAKFVVPREGRPPR